jgi:hypothetical protein
MRCPREVDNQSSFVLPGRHASRSLLCGQSHTMIAAQLHTTPLGRLDRRCR